MKYEKIKFGAAVYDLVSGGVRWNEDKARLVFQPGEKTYDQVEADICGAARIALLDTTGETIEARTGFTVINSLTKEYDYVIGTEQVEIGTDPDTNEPITETKNVTGTVMVASLRKEDLRAVVARLQEIVEIHDGAIGDMGAVLSTVAAQEGGVQ